MVTEHHPEHDHICWGCGQHHPHAPHTLRVEGLSAGYGASLALEDVSFEAACGHTLALIGPNGAGKSTLLNTLAGLIRPAAGRMLWNGRPLREHKHEIAYVPQRNEVDWHFPLTVGELVAMGRYPALGAWKAYSAHDREIIERALAAMKLDALRDRQIGELSGGQQQRVFLARALAQEAHILLLDEPFTGLDVPGTEALGALLRELAAEGRLIIASHHDLASAPAIFGQALLLNRRVAAYGATETVLTPERLSALFGTTPTAR